MLTGIPGKTGIVYTLDRETRTRILQAATADVVILHEMIHEARIVPVTDRAHIDGDVELWTGDARAQTLGSGPRRWRWPWSSAATSTGASTTPRGRSGDRPRLTVSGFPVTYGSTAGST